MNWTVEEQEVIFCVAAVVNNGELKVQGEGEDGH